MKQDKKRSRAKAQRRKDSLIFCGRVFGYGALTRTMVFAGLFLLMGAGAVSGSQIDPSSAPSGLQPSGSSAALNPQPAGAPASTKPRMVRGPIAANQTGSQSSIARPADLGASPVGDIRDIRGPLHIPDPLAWLTYGIAGLLLLLASAWFWRWFRKRKTERNKLPFELAFEQLERAKAFMKPETAGRFSVMVSAAVRNYIEKRFEMEVTKHTTEEFMRRVAAEPSGGIKGYEDLLNGFLGYCDLAKFARYVLTLKQMEEMLQSALHFVDATKPRPEEEKTCRKGNKVEPAAEEEGVQKSSSLFKRWWGKGLGFISGKTTLRAALDQGGAVAEGGR